MSRMTTHVGMAGPITHNHLTDVDGNPAGGNTTGVGFDIDWQDGPLGRAEDGTRQEANGAFVEDVLLAVIDRIRWYQDSEFHCIHNAAALGHLYAAREVLHERSRDREDRKVEGTHQR